MTDLDPGTVATLVVVALVLAGVLLLVNVGLVVRVVQLRRQLKAAFPDGTEDVVEVLVRHSDEISGVRDDLATVHGNTERLREHLLGVTSRIGIVRYDAFDDVAGAQSFSAALLDRRGSGIVISAINGRHETRCYGKEIVKGDSEHTLSDEEREAIRSALEGRPVATLTGSPRRRKRAS